MAEDTHPVTRRTVVATGVKLAYAVPIVAATMKLGAGNALALSGDFAGTCAGGSGQGCGDYDSCGSTVNNTPCVCARAGNQTVCSAYGGCDVLCDTDADCVSVTGSNGDTGPGYCHTDTCCPTNGRAGACAPLCFTVVAN